MLTKRITKFFSGHIRIGNVTVYGRNAMHWGVVVWTKRWGAVCFRLPLRCFGRWWPLYFYVSPNATPWASTYYIGGLDWEHQGDKARRRRRAFGHNFSTDVHRVALWAINNDDGDEEAGDDE